MENSQSLTAIAENWYARLNRLKDRHVKGGLSTEKQEQLIKLIGIMLGRMMKLMPHYAAMMHSGFKPKSSFHPGGLINQRIDIKLNSSH